VLALPCFLFVDTIIEPLIPAWSGTFAMLAAGLVSLIPYGLVMVCFPPAIEVSTDSRTIDYEFRDPEYARDFEECNSFLEADPFSDPNVAM
jgi:hypothetical protein